MVSGIDDRLHRLRTQPGQTLRGRVNHRTREPLLRYSQNSSHRIAESCPAVNIIVIIMKLWNCRFSVIKGGCRQYRRRTSHEAGIAAAGTTQDSEYSRDQEMSMRTTRTRKVACAVAMAGVPSVAPLRA